MPESIQHLLAWLDKQEEEPEAPIDLMDWTDGDPRAKAKNIIEVPAEIDYDPENAFWISSSRKTV